MISFHCDHRDLIFHLLLREVNHVLRHHRCYFLLAAFPSWMIVYAFFVGSAALWEALSSASHKKSVNNHPRRKGGEEKAASDDDEVGYY